MTAACGGSGRPRADEPSRIVAVAPNVVQILFTLGLGGRVVGVGDHVTLPTGAPERARIGGLFDPRLEQIAALEPDLAVLLRSEESLARYLRRLGIEVLVVESDTLQDVEQAVLRIADRCGVGAEGERLAARWRRELAPRSLERPLRVALVLDRRPGELRQILVAGPGNYLDELLIRAGARNVFSDAPSSYPQVGLEQILERQPDALVELRSDPPGGESLEADWRRLPELETRCFVELVDESALVPGPGLPAIFDRLHRELAECGVEP